MAAPASSRSTVSNTAQASPLGSYQSTNRLTSSTTAPRATSPVPASNRSRKTAVPPRESGSGLSEADAAARRRRWSRRCALPAADDGARLRVHARACGARGDPHRQLALGRAVAGELRLRLALQPGRDEHANPVRAGLHRRHAPHEPLRLAREHPPERPRVRVGGRRSLGRAVDHPHRALGVGEVGLLAARRERVDGPRDVRDRPPARVAHLDDEPRRRREALAGREGRAHDRDAVGPRLLCGVLGGAAAAGRDAEHGERRDGRGDRAHGARGLHSARDRSTNGERQIRARRALGLTRDIVPARAWPWARETEVHRRGWMVRSVADRAFLPAKNLLEEVGGMIILTGQTIVSALRPPYPYGGEFVSQFLFALRLCWFPLLVSTVAFGYAAPGLQAANFLVLFGALDRLGGFFVLASIREFAPFVDAVVLAGVAGTAITADLGARKIREELDALQVLGVDPVKNLVVPRFLALMLVTGLFDIYALLFGIFGGIVATLVNGAPLGPFWATFFTNSSIVDLWGSVLKCTMFGAIIAIVCCYKGMTASGGAEGVGRAVNQAVVIATLGVFAFNYVFTQTLLATHPEILNIK